MGCGLSTPNPFVLSAAIPQSVNFPIELFLRVLEISLEPYDGRKGPQRAWISSVALVSKSVNSFATPKLYDIIQLAEQRSLLLLATTLSQRHDLACSVKALHLEHSLARSKGAASSCQQLVALCSNAFLQANESAFDPNGYVAAVPDQPLPSWSGHHYLSVSGRDETQSLPPHLHLETLHATHLHFGARQSSTSIEVLWNFLRLVVECKQQVRVATTHFAVDADFDSNSRQNVFKLVEQFLRRAPRTLQRVVIRLPFDSQSTLVAESDTQTWLGNELATIQPLLPRDPRVFVSFVEINLSADQDGLHELAVGGWRRHAQGVEDLWMSGVPVFPVI